MISADGYLRKMGYCLIEESLGNKDGKLNKHFFTK